MKNPDAENPYPSVLIVDDEIDICYLLSALLREKKYNTHSVFDLAQARQALKNKQPHILFLDNHLTDGLGLDFIEYVREQSPDTKIIMITAYDDQASRQLAFKRGAHEFISKPLRREVISQALERLTAEQATSTI